MYCSLHLHHSFRKQCYSILFSNGHNSLEILWIIYRHAFCFKFCLLVCSFEAEGTEYAKTKMPYIQLLYPWNQTCSNCYTTVMKAHARVLLHVWLYGRQKCAQCLCSNSDDLHRYGSKTMYCSIHLTQIRTNSTVVPKVVIDLVQYDFHIDRKLIYHSR